MTQPGRSASDGVGVALDHILVPRYGKPDDYLRRCVDVRCMASSVVVSEGWPPVTHKDGCAVAEALAALATPPPAPDGERGTDGCVCGHRQGVHTGDARPGLCYPTGTIRGACSCPRFTSRPPTPAAAVSVSALVCPAATHHRMKSYRAATIVAWDGDDGPVYGDRTLESDRCTACGFDFLAAARDTGALGE